MEIHLCVLSQLIQRLEFQVTPVKGSVYGLTTNDGRVLAVTVVVSSNSTGLEHDVSLLLPVPLVRIGSFNVCKGDHTMPDLEEGEVSLVWDQIELHTYVRGTNGTESTKFTTLSQDELNQSFIMAKVAFSFDVSAKDSPSSIRSTVQSLMEQVESPAACFRFLNSKLILQNSEEGVLTLGDSLSGSDKPVGSIVKIGKKKASSQQMTYFQFMFCRSVCPATNAPVVRIDNRKVNVLSVVLNGEAIVYLEKSLPVSAVAELLAQGVVQQLQLAEFWLCKQLTDKKIKGSLTSVNSLHFLAGHVVNVIYPDDTEEAHLEGYRREVHRTLLFPLNRPMIRRGNGLTLASGSKSLVLTNTHIGLNPSKVIGMVRTVAGTYGYHHYMQDKFDDNKWGCAYRSLQTLISWFRYQGYTEKPIPAHREIQKCLVDIGDKPSSFIGSTQWIGSTEVGFVLDNMFNISSRFIFVNSGAELAEKGRELAIHFETQGTPIMIGGGVLAHTIIGVDWNDENGDISFLILDPHYTGNDDLSTIQSKGWCGWKGPDFWNASAYYNLCLPQRPMCI